MGGGRSVGPVEPLKECVEWPWAAGQAQPRELGPPAPALQRVRPPAGPSARPPPRSSARGRRCQPGTPGCVARRGKTPAPGQPEGGRSSASPGPRHPTGAHPDPEVDGERSAVDRGPERCLAFDLPLRDVEEGADPEDHAPTLAPGAGRMRHMSDADERGVRPARPHQRLTPDGQADARGAHLRPQGQALDATSAAGRGSGTTAPAGWSPTRPSTSLGSARADWFGREAPMRAWRSARASARPPRPSRLPGRRLTTCLPRGLAARDRRIRGCGGLRRAAATNVRFCSVARRGGQWSAWFAPERPRRVVEPLPRPLAREGAPQAAAGHAVLREAGRASRLAPGGDLAAGHRLVRLRRADGSRCSTPSRCSRVAWWPRWEERPVTKFERKGLAAGRTITDLAYVPL